MGSHQLPKDGIHPIVTNLAASKYAEPVEIIALKESLKVETFVDYVDHIFQEDISDISDVSSDEESETLKLNSHLYSKYKKSFTPTEWKGETTSFFNFKSTGKERNWLKETLLTTLEESDDNEEKIKFDQEYLHQMLKRHVCQKKIAKQFHMDSLYYHEKYFSYGSSLILEHDKYHDRQKRRSACETIRKKPVKFSKKKKDKITIEKDNKKNLEMKLLKQKKEYEKDMQYRRRKLWNFIIKKDIPKASRARATTRGTCLQTLKKVAQACQRERRKEALRSLKISKDALPRARRMAKEMLLYWRKFDKVEKEHRKKAEKEAIEQKRHDEEMREMKRQQRKLNFLITQTELYAHFMSKKMKGSAQDLDNPILKQLDETPKQNSSTITVNGGYMVNNTVDDYDSATVKKQVIQNVQNAVSQQRKNANSYKLNDAQQSFDGTFSLANPSLEEEKEHPQPRIFNGRLKPYQLKGMNWLISLYEKGINGILADEMGLGKTVQSIVFLGYLAEAYNIWGPFLVVAPASTLHNWQQEFSKFLPIFKVLPYWGDPNDRKSLRKYWNQKSTYFTDSQENAPFHVLITSYQLIVQDVKYFQRIRWQYIVLDEAHAIKSSQSQRWKVLLGYNCRNRLLLTGTPIQNTMAELWALLHFIMPTLFDSHEEFNEWFSKDIENHANEKRPNLDQNQLSRLHMILKPFMLRRVKKDVENELSEKIEIKVICDMSSRQKLFYQAVKNKIMFEDILQSATTTSAENKSTSILMNLVMQFRKVCNHPELFERKEPTRNFHFALQPLTLPKLLFDYYTSSNGLALTKFPSFEHLFQIWHPYYVAQSLKDETRCFGFTRFINLSPCECFILFTNVVERLKNMLMILKELKKEEHRRKFRKENNKGSRYLSKKDLLIYQPSNLFSSSNKYEESLCFTGYKTNFCSYQTYHIREIKTTVNKTGNCLQKEHEERHCQPVYYPNYFRTYHDKVLSPPVQLYCSYRRAANYFKDQTNNSLYRILEDGLLDNKQVPLFRPLSLQGLRDIRPEEGWSKVQLPDRSTLVSDSGKLTVLDQLLTRLKRNDHRVLIYSQMTKMIDIIEEFMNFRHHTYIRLDGSSKISDRRDMVANFQERNDIFAFLLSTRAGGLGINLTAADTVIFYDSDWNPTVDQQAMDRAHRLGQTKQVTVYRLVTKGTVEEKILNRAREKSEIQNIVISGGQFNKDVLRPKEVVSLLLDDAELDSKIKQRQLEKKQAMESAKRPGRKRRNNQESQPIVNGKRIKNETLDENGFPITPQDFVSIDMDENSMSSIELGGSSILEEESSNTSRPSSCNPSSPLTVDTNTIKRQNSKGRPGGRSKTKTKAGTLAKAAASAAALAGAAAGSAAAYAAYGYSYQSTNT